MREWTRINNGWWIFCLRLTLLVGIWQTVKRYRIKLDHGENRHLSLRWGWSGMEFQYRLHSASQRVQSTAYAGSKQDSRWSRSGEWMRQNWWWGGVEEWGNDSEQKVSCKNPEPESEVENEHKLFIWKTPYPTYYGCQFPTLRNLILLMIWRTVPCPIWNQKNVWYVFFTKYKDKW